MLRPAGHDPNYGHFSSGAIFKRISPILTFTTFSHPTNLPKSEIPLGLLKIHFLLGSVSIVSNV